MLDPRTRMILFKMLNQGVISEINGCISTGKEANVYHARMPDGTEGAIKVSTAACSLQRRPDSSLGTPC